MAKTNKTEREVKIREVMLDGHLVRKVCCPLCGIWGYVDDDQFFGRVSILCGCGFHETMNLAELFPKEIENERDTCNTR